MDSRAITLLPDSGQGCLACKFHRALGGIYSSRYQRGNARYAIRHFETAVRITSPFNWHDVLFLTHYSLAEPFLDEVGFDDAQTHVDQAKSYTVGNAYHLGQAMEVQAKIWYQQHRFEGATSEVLRATKVFENLRAASDVERCKMLL